MKKVGIIHLLVAIGAYSGGFVVHSTVHVWAITEGPISPLHWSSPPLIHKVPVKARKRSVLVAFVLKEGFALFHTKFL